MIIPVRHDKNITSDDRTIARYLELLDHEFVILNALWLMLLFHGNFAEPLERSSDEN